MSALAASISNLGITLQQLGDYIQQGAVYLHPRDLTRFGERVTIPVTRRVA